jgi:hypothetical protein
MFWKGYYIIPKIKKLGMFLKKNNKGGSNSA